MKQLFISLLAFFAVTTAAIPPAAAQTAPDKAPGYISLAEGDYNADAPSAPTELEADFAPGELWGYVSFTAPTTTNAGEYLSGNLNFSVAIDGVETETGTVYTGVNRTVYITVPVVGVYQISVTVSNSDGVSPAATITAYAGYDAPATPTVTVTLNNNTLNVKWSEVTAGDAEVTYRVVRYPDSTTVVESTTETEYSEQVEPSDNAKVYYYGVTATANGTDSEEGISNSIMLGQMTPPYTESFPDVESTALWTIIDSNQDGYTWSFYYGEMRSQANSQLDADDWLISPPIAIEGSKYYLVSVDVKTESASYPGKFELKYGTAPTAEAMTATIIDPVVITNETYVTYQGVIRIDGESANYYFGIHSLTEADMWWLRATNFSVSAPLNDNAPAAPSSMTVKPDFNGALKAEVSVTAPDQTIVGGTLSAISKLEIFRNGQLVHTAENVTPRAIVNFTDDNFTEKGLYRYTAVATNDYGFGLEAATKAFVGINIPGAPTNAHVIETATNGEVTITWDAPATDIDGTPINPDLVTYNIYTPIYGEDVLLFKDIEGTSKTFQTIFPDEEQIFFYYCVTASTEAGENPEIAITEQIPAGEPYQAPYNDSFANRSTDYLYGTGACDNQTYWEISASTKNVTPQDNDGGMFVMYGYNADKWASFQTGKVKIAGMDNPMLTFYIYRTPATTTNNNTLELLVNDRTGFNSLKKWTIGTLENEGWNRIEIPLNEYNGKEIYFKFIGTMMDFKYIHVDNIQIRNRQNQDLAITAISAPERVKTETDEVISVNYNNFGLQDADNFTIELQRNGEKIDEKTFDQLASDGTGTLQFHINHNVTMSEAMTYKAVINYDKDLVASNNTSDNVSILTIMPHYPTVTDLVAISTYDNPLKVNLSWSAPSQIGDYDEDTLESFETYPSWANSNLGDWKLYDGDLGGIYGFSGLEIPGIRNGSQQSYWVMDDTFQPLIDHFKTPDYYKANSGHKYLTQMSVTIGEENVTCDDWLISPQLYGGKQTVSLYAHSCFETFPEKFELLVSDSGNNLDDFERLETVYDVPHTWTKYYFDLPEGTKYFAVHCTSHDCYMLMLDDINFTPETDGVALEIAGYNAYCNGKKLNETPISSTRFEAARPSEGSDVYTVTAVYKERGESQYSNEAVPEMAGIDMVKANSNIAVYTAAGEIIVTNACDQTINVVGIDGRTINTAIGTDKTVIPVAQGVYIVNVANQAFKVIVK